MLCHQYRIFFSEIKEQLQQAIQEQKERDEFVKELELTQNNESVVLEEGLNSEFAEVSYDDPITHEATDMAKIEFTSSAVSYV